MKIRLLTGVALTVGLLVGSPALLPRASMLDTADAQISIVTIEATPDDADSIIGSPNAGPKPQHSGERGGWAQLLLLGILITAVSFIMWRILHNSRGDKRTSPT